MVFTLTPEQLLQLRAIFLEELAGDYPPAREAHRRLLEAPGDLESLRQLQSFFHKVAGSGGRGGFEVLGHSAVVCEALASIAAAEGPAFHPASVKAALGHGLDGVAFVLESSKGWAAPPSARVVPPSTDASTVRAQPVLSRILVVDDDPVNTTLVERILSDAGLTCSSCSDPRRALESVEGQLPDLILLDVDMPGMDGFELCQRIRAHPALQFTPVVFLTRRSDVDQRVRGLEAGGSDYLVKPFEPAELVARVRSHLLRLAALHEMAIRDGLTNCFNHRYFKDRLEQEIRRAKRLNDEFSLAMVDIDHFKTVNDSFGHPAGDIVLATIARLVMASVRTTDLAARYGGEEFALLLLQSTGAEASLVANRICQRVASHVFSVNPVGAAVPLELRATVSVGVGQFRPDDDAESLVRRVDAALYAAKSQGRNRVLSDSAA